MLYDIYENGKLIQTTEYPQWQAWDEEVKSFYCVLEKDAKAILIMPEKEGEESFYANIEGISGYSWLTRTVEVRKK